MGEDLKYLEVIGWRNYWVICHVKHKFFNNCLWVFWILCRTKNGYFRIFICNKICMDSLKNHAHGIEANWGLVLNFSSKNTQQASGHTV